MRRIRRGEMRCKDCKHWGAGDKCATRLPYSLQSPIENRTVETEVDDWSEDTDPCVMPEGYVKVCCNPAISFYTVPAPGAATVVDGSEYTASLLTTEDFGCTLFEK